MLNFENIAVRDNNPSSSLLKNSERKFLLLNKSFDARCHFLCPAKSEGDISC